MSDIWFNRGTVEPSLDDWKSFDNPSVNGSIIRVSFDLTAESLGSIFTRLLLRRYWATTQPTQGRPILIYPSIEAVVVNVPLGQAYADAGLTTYYWQARLILKRRFRAWRFANEPLYNVTLEEI